MSGARVSSRSEDIGASLAEKRPSDGVWVADAPAGAHLDPTTQLDSYNHNGTFGEGSSSILSSSTHEPVRADNKLPTVHSTGERGRGGSPMSAGQAPRGEDATVSLDPSTRCAPYGRDGVPDVRELRVASRLNNKRQVRSHADENVFFESSEEEGNDGSEDMSRTAMKPLARKIPWRLVPPHEAASSM